ncbi:hypothetical protein ALC60_02071 [Trachymyrmex zeteki]|uniref:Uncharacterized protein n=1 Tax=Mycetomoellerius zeteki TaxID=64791 RepID=A0A151XF05_9HYME|nr:hypothetical protein ALC60_02071 [Trachymyrmex zeteki]
MISILHEQLGMKKLSVRWVSNKIDRGRLRGMSVHDDGYGSNNDSKEQWTMWMAAQCSSSRSNINDNGINDENGSNVESCN